MVRRYNWQDRKGMEGEGGGEGGLHLMGTSSQMTSWPIVLLNVLKTQVRPVLYWVSLHFRVPENQVYFTDFTGTWPPPCCCARILSRRIPSC